jgi:hypothetical protein
MRGRPYFTSLSQYSTGGGVGEALKGDRGTVGDSHIYIYIWVYTYIYTHEYVYARRYTRDLSHQHVFCRWTSEGIYTSLITEIA